MQNNSNMVIFYPTPVIESLTEDQEHYIFLQNKLNYMASCLGSALLAFSKWNENEDNEKWWLDGFQYEIVC